MSELNKNFGTISQQVAASKKLTGGKGKWFPLIWLPYYLFFFLQPVFDHSPVNRWIETGE